LTVPADSGSAGRLFNGRETPFLKEDIEDPRSSSIEVLREVPVDAGVDDADGHIADRTCPSQPIRIPAGPLGFAAGHILWRALSVVSPRFPGKRIYLLRLVDHQAESGGGV